MAARSALIVARDRTVASAELADAETVLTAAADRLDAIEPPEDLSIVHWRFIDGVRSLARSLGQARAAADAGDGAAFEAAAERSETTNSTLVVLVARYEALGYTRFARQLQN